jgi:geranyl-CoA carboxylase alpha subunit
MAEDALSTKTLALAAMLIYQCKSPVSPDTDWHTPAPYRYNFKLGCDGKDHHVSLVKRGGRFTVTTGDQEIVLEWAGAVRGSLAYIDGGVLRRARFAFDAEMLYLDAGTGHFIFEDKTLEIAAGAGAAGSGDIHSAMNGLVVEVLVSEGQQVEAGQTLLVLESMKMQHQIAAGVTGTVTSVMVSAGEQVKPSQLLVQLSAEETEGETA